MTAAGAPRACSAPEVPAGALDPELMSRRLAPFLDGGAGARVLAAHLVGVAPGRRAVIAYSTAHAGGGAGPSLIAKTYTDGVRAHRLHAVLEDLTALDIAVPRPVAHLPELRMSVFTASPGRSLERLGGGEREAAVVEVARWLSVLHGSPLSLDRWFDLDAETRGLNGAARLVADRLPRAAATADLLARRLGALAEGLPISATSPIHKDLHYRHTLVEADRMVVIDLDEVRSGDPGCDVAHFAANLRLLAIREGTPAGERTHLETAFLEAYASRTGYRCDARHRWFGGFTCLKIARQLVCGRGPAPVPAGAEIDRQVEHILDEGLRCLEC